MTLTCKKCLLEINKRDYIQCAQCQNYFHLDCTSISEKLFYLMTPDKRTKCKCDTCKDCFSNQKVNIPTNNSFQMLSDEETSTDLHDDFITLRERRKPVSLQNLTGSFLSTEDTCAPSSHSLPDATVREDDVIEEMREEIKQLKMQLEIAHKEIDILNIENGKLTNKVKAQEKIIKLYKTIGIEELSQGPKINKSCMSTPLTNCKRRKQAQHGNEIFINSSEKTKEQIPYTECKTNSSLSSTYDTSLADDNGHEKRQTKLCLITGIERNNTSRIVKSYFQETNMCHYRLPGASASDLVNGLQEKLKNFSASDFCVIMLGETDFNKSKNYKYLVSELRKKLSTVQHTNIILCLPTFKLNNANILNKRIEVFNSLLYYDNLEHSYCYLIDSNRNIQYSWNMFSRKDCRINNRGIKIIMNDICEQIQTIMLYEGQLDRHDLSLSKETSEVRVRTNTRKKSSFRA